MNTHPNSSLGVTSFFQSALDMTRLSALGAQNAKCMGSIKGAAAPLPVDRAAVGAVNEVLSGNVIGSGKNACQRRRRVWLAASTHDREEEIAALAHEGVIKAAARGQDDDTGVRASGHGDSDSVPLLVIIPRHPQRCARIVEALAKKHPHWEIALYSQLPSISCLATVDLLVVDALGVMGEWYSIAEVALVGGSMVDGIGGHNIMEPALLGCVPLHGPFAFNGQHLIDALRQEDSSCIRQVCSCEELTAAVVDVLQEGGPSQSAVRAAAEKVRMSSCARLVDAVNDAIHGKPSKFN